jgi:hypothetical protein
MKTLPTFTTWKAAFKWVRTKGCPSTVNMCASADVLPEEAGRWKLYPSGHAEHLTRHKGR